MGQTFSSQYSSSSSSRQNRLRKDTGEFFVFQELKNFFKTLLSSIFGTNDSLKLWNLYSFCDVYFLGVNDISRYYNFRFLRKIIIEKAFLSLWIFSGNFTYLHTFEFTWELLSFFTQWKIAFLVLKICFVNKLTYDVCQVYVIL